MFQLVIVDDKKTIREGLRKHMPWETLGFAVAGDFPSAKEAIDFVETEVVDVILSDIVMPEMTGLELARELRLINPDCKLIFLSAYERFDYAQEAVQLGAMRYFTKPVDLEELQEAFRELQEILVDERDERMNNEEARRALLTLQARTPSLNSKDGPIIESVKDYIEEHYYEEITLQVLAEKVYVNPSYLSRLFKEKTGLNYTDYLTEVRIAHAQELLKDLSLRIYDIAGLVGYVSRKHFSKVFKGRTGLSPKDYRDRLSL